MKVNDPIVWGKEMILVDGWTMTPRLADKCDGDTSSPDVIVDFLHGGVAPILVPVYYEVKTYNDLITELYAASWRYKIVNEGKERYVWEDAIGVLFSNTEHFDRANKNV